MPSRQQQSRLTVTVDGRALGVWDDRTGGDTDSNSVQYFLGAMGPRMSLGGSQQVNNVIIQVLQTDMIMTNAKWLLSRAGKGKMVVIEQPLDDEGVPLGEPFGWQGVLKRSKLSDRNAQANNPAQFELEMEVTGSVF